MKVSRGLSSLFLQLRAACLCGFAVLLASCGGGGNSASPTSNTPPPTPAAISSVAPNSGPVFGGTTVVITGSNFAPGATVAFGNTDASGLFIDGPTQIRAIAPAGAAGAVTIRVTNPGASAATLNNGYTYDASPAIQTITPATGSSFGGTAVTIQGGNFQSGAQITFRGQAATSIVVVDANHITATTPPNSAGPANVVIRNPDSSTGTFSNGFQYTTPPTITNTTPASGSTTGGSVVTISGSNFQNGASVLFGATPSSTVSFVSTTQLTAVAPAQASGIVDITVTNPDTFSAVRSGAFTYVPPPSLTAVSPGTVSTAGGMTVALSGNNFQSGATVSFGGTAASSLTVLNATQISAVVPAHAAATVNVQVTNPDTQTVTLPAALTFSNTVVSNVTPNSGSAAGGTSVTINGSGFQPGLSVAFGGINAASVVFVSSTQVTATTPDHASGAVAVTVTNPDTSSGTLASAFTYTAPTVTSLSPLTGAAAGGNLVTINGTNFQTGAGVSFGGTNSATVNFINAGQLTAIAPAHAAGAVSISVTDPDSTSGSKATAYTYVAPPSITSISPSSGAIGGGTAITITGTGFQSGAGVTVGGTNATSIVFVNAGQLTAITPAGAAGSVAVKVTNPDAQNTTAAAAFTYLAPATVASILPTSGASAGGTSVTINGSNFVPGATVSFGASPASAVTFVNSTKLMAVTPAHAPGISDLFVTDPNASPGSLLASYTFNSPPTVSTVTPNTGSSFGGTSVTIQGSNCQSGAQVTFRGQPATSIIFVDAGHITANTPANSSGAADVVVINPDSASSTLTNGFTYTTPPTITNALPASGSTAGGATVTITGSAFQNGATVKFGATAASSITFVNSTQLNAIAPPHAAGNVDITVTNPDTFSAIRSGAFTYLPPPSITSVSPNKVSSAGGATVAISGSDFQTGAAVSFGGAPAASVTVVNATQINAVVPAHSAATVSVQVTNPDTQSASLPASLTFQDTLITSIAPNSGSPAGGTSVTINGANFQSGISVTFGGVNAASVSFVNSNQVTATTPAHVSGAVDATVTNLDTSTATSVGGFTFTTVDVNTVLPTSGPTSGGTLVTINGANFQSGAGVSFGGTSSATVSFINSGQLTAVAPAHASGTISITVTNPDTSNGTKTSAYTYVPPPTVTAAAPGSGSTVGGTAITITGTGFQSGATVTVGGNSATSVVFVNATQLTAVTPAGAAGAASVSVTNPDTQTGTKASGFTFLPPANITSILPTSGASAGGTSVTINGSNFAAGATVAFDAVPATAVTFVNSTKLRAITPAHVAGTATLFVTNPGTSASSLPASYTFNAPPTISTVTPNTGSSFGGTAVTIQGANFQGGAQVTFRGQPATSIVVVDSGHITANTPANTAGAANVVVTNPDSASNTLTNGFTYTTPPAISSTTPTSGPTAGGTIVTINGNNFQNGATALFGAVPSSTVSFVNGTQLTAVAPAQAAGTVGITVTNPDTFSAVRNAAFTYLSAPSLTTISPNTVSTAGGMAVSITGTNFQSGATASFGGAAASSVTVLSATQISAVVPAHTAATVNVQVTNPDTQSASLAAALTFVNPVITTVTPNTGTGAGGTSVTINGSGFQSGLSVAFGGINAASVAFVNSTQVTATTPAHASGVVSVTVTNPDTSAASLASAFTYTAPVVTSVSPLTGAAAGGNLVTINGSNFQAGAGVSFGGTNSSTVNFINAGQLTALAPAHAAGAVSITVTNPDSTSGSKATAYTYIAPPAVTGVTPSSGPTGGGTAITINGTEFQSGAGVTVGGTNATSIVFVNANQLTAITPAGGAGSAAVKVTNPDTQSATAASAFTYLPAATVTSITPTSGASAGGTSVTINGSNFAPGATVAFDAIPASAVTFVSSTKLMAVTPAHTPGVSDLFVTNPGTTPTALFSSFNFNPLPTATAVAPTTGSTFGGATVTISGTNFVSGATASFGGTNASGIVVTNSTQIQAVTPSHVAGAVNVQVINPDGGSGSASNAYTYVKPPGVTAVMPNFGSPAGGTSVTITGADFKSGALVTFDGVNATNVTFVSATQLTAKTPAHAAGAVAVQVTNPDGQSSVLNNGFTYANVLISAISPVKGTSAGGTAVTITGSSFTTGATVTIGGNAAASVVVVNSTTITAVTPAHAAAAVDVTVKNPDNSSATLTGAFTYFAGPSITKISPDSGLLTGGTPVTITGTNFSNTGGFFATLTVSFIDPNGTVIPIPNVTFVNSTTLQIVTPPLPNGLVLGAKDVKVVNADNQSVTRTGGFRYGQILFQDGFDTNGLGNFDFVQTPFDYSLNVNTPFVRNGGFSAQAHYVICATCGSAHQDNNRWIQKNFNSTNGFPNGLRHFNIRASIYIKSPEPGGTQNGIQRKLFYIKAPSGPNGTPNYQWAVVLTSDTANGHLGLRLGYESLGGVTSAALYGNDNELGSKSNTVNGIAELPFDTWNTVELEIGAKSALGSNDSVLRFWVNGTLAFEKLTTWTTAPVPCRVGGTFSCPPFPDDSVFNDGIVRMEIGTQVDRLNFDPVDEYRFFDDIAIADAYIGPP